MPCTLDLRDDDAVKAFVAKVGKVDVLVNSAYEGLAAQKAQLGKKFYERPLGEYDDHMSGVRWAYALSQLVAPGMVEAKSGLIVNISSAGGIFYFCGVPYGVMHAALDKLGADVATELKGTGVTCVTVWPGGAVTERTSFPGGETPALTGRAVAALAAAGAEDLAGKSGKVLLTCELGAEYDFVDATGERPVDGMGVRGMLNEGFKYPLAGGALGDHTQSNNEGMKAVFHGY